jgi:hypothetical protein
MVDTLTHSSYVFADSVGNINTTNTIMYIVGFIERDMAGLCVVTDLYLIHGSTVYAFRLCSVKNSIKLACESIQSLLEIPSTLSAKSSCYIPWQGTVLYLG